MTKTTFERVREFHTKFGHPVNDGKPDLASLPEDLVTLRMNLIAEEFVELVEAVYGKPAAEAIDEAWSTMYAQGLDRNADGDRNLDTVEAGDALGDMDYVISGFAHVAAIPHDNVVKEIHDSNMSKLGADGKPILREDGKILKGPDYFRPNIARVFDEKE